MPAIEQKGYSKKYLLVSLMDSIEQFRFRKRPHERDETPKASKPRPDDITPAATPPAPRQDAAAIPPFTSPDTPWRERFAACCTPCADARAPCAHTVEAPLRLLFIGHNPSDHAWASGFFYSNPSNRFYPLLRDAAIIPRDWGAAHNPRMAVELGIGFTGGV